MSAELATRLIVVRHGETDWNASARIQGHTDIGLNAEGCWQAERLAQALAGETLDAVYSSDLSRATETARPLARRTGAPLRLDPALRERAFGRFEGISHAEVAQHWPDDAARWRRRDIDFAPPGGGETLGAFHSRAVAAAMRLSAAHRGGTIAIVAHGGVLDCLYRAAVRLALDAPRQWQLGNASINRLLSSDQGLSLVGWNDDRHLDRQLDEPSASL